MLCNVQNLDMGHYPSAFSVQESRSLYEDLARGPTKGIPALRILSQAVPRGRIFIWPPGGHVQLERLFVSFEAAAALGLPIPDFSLFTLCDAYPGVTSTQSLLDFWRPPFLQNEWHRHREFGIPSAARQMRHCRGYRPQGGQQIYPHRDDGSHTCPYARSYDQLATCVAVGHPRTCHPNRWPRRALALLATGCHTDQHPTHP